jgi:hypothetical protein
LKLTKPIKFFHALFSVPLRPIFRRILPAPVFATVELSIWGWEFRDKAAIHEKLGPAFIIVTTGLNQLICADPTMAHAILGRRKDFVHPKMTTEAMGFLGKNILTVSSFISLHKGRSIRHMLLFASCANKSRTERRRSMVSPTSHHCPGLERTYKFGGLE